MLTVQCQDADNGQNRQMCIEEQQDAKMQKKNSLAENCKPLLFATFPIVVSNSSFLSSDVQGQAYVNVSYCVTSTTCGKWRFLPAST